MTKIYKVTYVHTDTFEDAFTKYYQSIYSAKKAIIKDYQRLNNSDCVFKNDGSFVFVEPLKCGFRDLYRNGHEYAPFFIQTIHVLK